MRSTKNSRAVTVGLFIFIGLSIFVVGVLALGGQRKTFAKTVKVRALFDDVSGLQAGNNIWFSGVKVGTVESMKFNGSAKVLVVMNIDVNAQPFIHNNSRAKIGSESLIGNKIIVIYGSEPNFPVIKDGDVLQVEKSATADDLMNSFQSASNNFMAITNDLKKITGDITEGKGTVGKLLKEDNIVNSLQQVLNTLQKTGSSAQAMTSNLSEYTRQLQTKGSLAHELVSDTAVFANIRRTALQLEKTGEQAQQIAMQIRETVSHLNDSSGSVGVLLHDRQAAGNIRSTLANLQNGSQKLNEDLEAVQHNFLLRGFFRKKEKQAQKIKNDSLQITFPSH